MKTIFFLLQKEFLQIFRNKTMLPIIFVLPLVQLIILVNAATLEMKNIDVLVVDQDNSVSSRELISHFTGSPFFTVFRNPVNNAYAWLEADRADMAIIIPHGFERKMVRENSGNIQFLINAINGTTAGVSNNYAAGIVADFSRNISTELQLVNPGLGLRKINVIPQYWYNPTLNYKNFMVPAVLVILVTMIGMFLASLNLVREKETGTMEQINVTPVKKVQFIIAKLLPFWVIALFELAIGLTIGKLLFQIPTLGSLGLLFFSAGIYMLVILGFGLLISTMVHTQQQAMLIAFFFMLIFILMSGVFTSVETMPEWARKLNFINPVAHFMSLTRMVLLKGSELKHVYHTQIILFIYGGLVLSLATMRYRKTV